MSEVVGRKYDKGKLEYGLLPVNALEQMVRILTDAVEENGGKYDRDNWQHVPDGRRRYWDACLRHMIEIKKGHALDRESKMHHAAHAAINAMFYLEHDLIYGASNTTSTPAGILPVTNPQGITPP